MNVIKHTKYIWELEDFIPSEEIDYFLGAFDFHNPVVNEDFRTDVRKNDTYDITEHQEINDIAWKWINSAREYYMFNNDWMYYGWPDEMLRSYTWQGTNIVRIYNKSDTYNWHTDQSPENIPEISLIVYLNDNFTGGRTLFLNDKLAVAPKKGTVLCFPVDHFHVHKGTTVTSGTKKIIWNCIYRQRVKLAPNTRMWATAPRSSKRCIW